MKLEAVYAKSSAGGTCNVEIFGSSCYPTVQAHYQAIVSSTMSNVE